MLKPKAIKEYDAVLTDDFSINKQKSEIILTKIEKYDTIKNILRQLNIFTQSVGYAAEGIAGGKGMRCESSAVNSRCMYRMFLYPSVKASHWETEKAGYKNAELTPYDTSQKTCFDIIP